MRKVLLCLTLLLAPTLTFADEKQTEADQRLEEGLRSYNLGKWDKAIDEWTKGYEIAGDALFLYNIGQAYRKKGDYASSITFYKSYLREDPETSKRAAIEERIAQMNELLIEQEQASQAPPSDMSGGTGGTTTGPPADDGSSVETPEVTGPPQEDRGAGLRRAGLVTGGVGVALVATGAVFGLLASGNASDLEAAERDGEPWASYRDLEDQRSRNVTISAVTLGLGGAAVIGGVVMYVIGGKKRSSSVSVVPLVAPASSGVAVHFTF